MNVLDELDAALKARNDELRRALGKAEAELRECEARCQHLRDRIAEVHGLLDPDRVLAQAAPKEHVTLHEAMRTVLAEAGPEGLSGPVLRDAITSRRLYQQRAGTPVSINQIHARARNYPQLFSRRDGRFVLAEVPNGSHAEKDADAAGQQEAVDDG